MVTPQYFELALGSASLAELERILAVQPDLHSLAFWHGITPLHRACLRADDPAGVARLLLACGADVNKCNAFGESPLMFACKRGTPKLIAMLINVGADLAARDNALRSVMHHAAMGGSVIAVHLLHKIMGMPCTDVDGRHQTPLHIVASLGSMELMKYLLQWKNGIIRVDPHMTDEFGNTALHVAALNGHARVTWKLLIHGGKSMVLTKNRDGLTPLDLAERQNTCKHRDTLVLLRYAHRLCSKTGAEIDGPVVAWYWHLLMPSCVYAVGLCLSRFLQDSFGSYVGIGCLAAIILYLVATVYRHSHRMEHVSDWPNPIYAGAFAGGMLSTLACYLAIILPSTNFTGSAYTIAATLLLTSVMLYCYWRLLFMDPGYVSDDISVNSATNYKLTIKDVIQDSLYLDSLCTSCEVRQQDDVKHCRLCDRCVFSLDHHCLYLMRCIAGRNHRMFVAFVVLVLLSQVAFLSAAVWHIIDVQPADNMGSTLASAVHFAVRTELCLSSLFILNLLSVIWGIGIIRWQLRLISLGQTYYASTKLVGGHHGTISCRTRFMNVINFIEGRNTSRYQQITNSHAVESF